MEIYMSNELRSAMKSQFRLASKEVCKPKAEYQMEGIGNTKSFTQVESLVLPPNSGAQKRDGIPGGVTNGVTKGRPNPLTIRLSDEHKELIRAKAQAAGVNVNVYAKAVLLGSDYRPPLNKELCRELFILNRELGRQGTNLNQIAKQLNAGIKTPDQAHNAVAFLLDELTLVYRAVYTTLMNGQEEA